PPLYPRKTVSQCTRIRPIPTLTWNISQTTSTARRSKSTSTWICDARSRARDSCSEAPSDIYQLLEDGNAFGAAGYMSARYDRWSVFADAVGGSRGMA